jgi:hypothetical protein
VGDSPSEGISYRPMNNRTTIQFRENVREKYWEIIADNISKAGWSWGCVSGVDSNGQTMFTVDAHRDGKRFVVRADEKLTAFLELECAVRAPSGYSGAY